MTDHIIPEMQREIREISDIVKGSWQDGDFRPGLVQQTNQMLREWGTIKDALVRVAWAIGRPIIIMLGAITVLGVVALIFLVRIIFHVDLSGIAKMIP